LRLNEVQRYLSLTAHWWTGFTLLAHEGRWQALPAAIRAVIERNAEKFALLQRDDIERVNADGAAALADRGMIVNTADAAALRRALGDFYRRWQAQSDPVAWALLDAAAGGLG
jgi:TRAP-type transport system periplasmic protein